MKKYEAPIPYGSAPIGLSRHCFSGVSASVYF